METDFSYIDENYKKLEKEIEKKNEKIIKNRAVRESLHLLCSFSLSN